MTEIKNASPDHPAIALYPLDIGFAGPAATRRLLRFFALYMILLSLGFALTQAPVSGAWQIFGLGLMIPGGGFLAHADIITSAGILHIFTAMAGMALFVFAGFFWFATGNAILPPVVWLALALAAALAHDGAPRQNIPWLLTSLIACGFCVVFVFWAIWRWHGIRRRRALNAQISAVNARAPSTTVKKTDATDEMPAADLRRMEFLLDRALQPVQNFDGFEWRDQFQTAALRYQVSFAGYALALAQARYMPALRGYIKTAQKNLIEKMADHRLWGYWQIENIWGNLDTNPDPAARDNIMFTGFLALQMALYHRLNNADDYTRDNSLLLHHPNGHTYDASLPRLLASLKQETAASAFHLIACEPNWIFPLCNAIGAAAECAADGATWHNRAKDFKDALEREFISANGMIFPFRSAYTGCAAPPVGGALTQALPVFFLSALMPDVAARQWLALKNNMLRENGTLRRRAFWPIDTGNYAFRRAAAYATAALAAGEMGDEEIKAQLLSALDRDCPVRSDHGHFYRPQASVWAHAAEFMARMSSKGSFHYLINAFTPDAGPHLTDVPYQKFIVADAHIKDGKLHCVLYPRHDKAQAGTITIGGMKAGREYTLQHGQAENITADAQGMATVTISLSSRTEITLTEVA